MIPDGRAELLVAVPPPFLATEHRRPTGNQIRHNGRCFHFARSPAFALLRRGKPSVARLRRPTLG